MIVSLGFFGRFTMNCLRHPLFSGNSTARHSASAAMIISAVAGLLVTGARAGATVTDVSYYDFGKIAMYVQTGNLTPAISTSNPYTFTSDIGYGSMGSVLASSTLALPAGATGTVTYAANSGNAHLKYSQFYATAADLNAAFPDGNYTFTINTSTPNTYTSTLALSGVTYPTDIGTLSNTNWSGGALVIDPTQNYTFTWNASADLHLDFGVNNTAINESVFNSGSGLPSSYTMAANTLAPGQSYVGNLDFANAVTDTSQISGVLGAAYYQNSTQFTIITTPEPAAGILLLAGVAVIGLLARRKTAV